MKFFILTAFLMSTAVQADVCYDSAKKFGKTNADVISGDCIQKTLKSSSGHQKHTSGNVQSLGYANILMVRVLNPLKEIIIAGEYTELSKIAATAIDETNKEVYALDSAKNAVYVFDSSLGGNVAPKRYLKSAELKDAIALIVDSKREVLVVVKSNAVLVYGRLAYNEGKRAAQSTKKTSYFDEHELKTFKIADVTYDETAGILSLIDSAQKKISVQINKSGQASLLPAE